MSTCTGTVTHPERDWAHHGWNAKATISTIAIQLALADAPGIRIRVLVSWRSFIDCLDYAVFGMSPNEAFSSPFSMRCTISSRGSGRWNRKP